MNNKQTIVTFALDLKEKFPLNLERRYNAKQIWIEIDQLTKKYLNDKL